MKRKVLSVMLCAAMVVSMTACGGSSSSNTADTTAAAKEAGDSAEQTGEAKQNRVKQPSRMHRRKNRSPVH